MKEKKVCVVLSVGVLVFQQFYETGLRLLSLCSQSLRQFFCVLELFQSVLANRGNSLTTLDFIIRIIKYYKLAGCLVICV